MQKDVHFYETYALCKLAGIDANQAQKIAWANQHTDELTNPKLYGIQTQIPIIGDWYDKQKQFSVLIPFHFMPGDDPDNHPWKVTRNSTRANHLASKAQSPFSLGIALHTLQDTFSHEGFSGWQEPLNSCFSWYKLEGIPPSVGHAEMKIIPDVVNYTWTDPRDGSVIDNRQRALSATKAVYSWLAIFGGMVGVGWDECRQLIEPALYLDEYEDRKQGFRELSGNPDIQYDDVTARMEEHHKQEFVRAANNHLSEAVRLFDGLPRG